MAESERDLKTLIRESLEQFKDLFELVQVMDGLASTDPKSFRELASTWALPLYERNPHFFQTFLKDHLHGAPLPAVESILARLEEDGDNDFFHELYRTVTNPDRYNADMLRLAQAKLSDQAFQDAINRRARWAYHSLTDEAAVALYRRGGDTVWMYIWRALDPHGKYPLLRAAAEGKHPELFKRYATTEEWVAKAREISAHTEPKLIAESLKRFQPEEETDLPVDLIQHLLRKYGENVEPYLAQNCLTYATQLGEQLVKNLHDSKSKGAEALVGILDAFRSRVEWKMMARIRNVWAKTVIELVPTHALNYLRGFTGNQHRAVNLELAQFALKLGHHDLFRELFTWGATQEAFNAEIRKVIEAKPPESILLRELQRLDINWMNLNDRNATDLYLLNPRVAWDFVFRHLDRRGGFYDGLIEAVRQNDADGEFFQRLFRRSGGGKAWERQMEDLLAQDIPPSQIVEELNRWHPGDVRNTNPKVLKKFLNKYGEAVLPYLERALNWLTEGRLRALLELPIERGALMRELSALVSRQPFEFQELARVWAPLLYEKGPEFFGSFLARHLNQRHEYVIRELLPRLEKDGHDKLYAQLYGRIIKEREWIAEIDKLMKQIPDDEQLQAALSRRDISWCSLPDELATRLYKRDHERFRDFVASHLGVGYVWTTRKREEYKQLRKEAERIGDTVMMDKVRAEVVQDARSWHEEAKALLKKGVAPEQISAELEKIHPTQTWNIKDTSILLEFVDRYGKAAMPYILNHQGWNIPRDRLLKAVKRLGDRVLYWRTFFATVGWRDNDAVKEWLEAVVDAAKTSHSEAGFAAALTILTPAEDTKHWSIDPQTARILYQRFPQTSRAFLEARLAQPDLEFFALVQKNGDEALLDHLSYRMMSALPQLLTQRSQARQKRERVEGERYVQTRDAVINRMEALYARSPEEYAEHVGNIFSRVAPFEISRWNLEERRDKNPIWQYLENQHREALVKSPGAMKEMLESPNIFVQIAAIRILSVGGRDAAQRVRENLPPIRALLMGGAMRKTKREALITLEKAAHEGPEFATPILASLEDLMDLRGKRSIHEDVMVTCARLQHALQEQV
ncbi:MAG: hypothetical protein IAE83_20845 [Anaerolinea sp.]|nr:hypothetical protein [Anaerolinea sp.]